MINKFMQLAIIEAWKYQFLTYPNPAVGACVVKNNQVLSVEAHKEAGLPHAEVLALKMAYLSKYPTSALKELESSHDIHDFLILNHSNFFIDCTIYVTLEPCNHIGKTPACAMLLESIKIKKVCIGTIDYSENASGGKQRLLDAQIEVEINICKKLTDKLLLPFLKYQNNKFVFFKIAMREDGSIDEGYITTQDSLNLVHEIRTKIDLMVIGGNTVRSDRPILDSRFSKEKKVPNILIYSNSNNFDKTIPLFNVKDRNVNISSSLECLDENNFIMIEGGYNLFNILQYKIDYLMLFISHKEKKKNHYEIDKKEFQIEYSYYLNEFDEIIFFKKIDNK
jgi:diaminohydroxyphosphoribosylaminopyrimidine deaminase / 5-amino-6-(5-phosphoribosylamino)uracil reductase